MSTVFANVTGALVGVLSGAIGGAPGGTLPVSPNIFRARLKPIAAESDTAVVVRVTDSVFDRFALRGAPVNLDTTAMVECYARSTTQEPDEAVDPLLQLVYARIAADPTLGGTVSDCQVQSITFDFASEQDRMGCAVITYAIQHRTQSLNLE